MLWLLIAIGIILVAVIAVIRLVMETITNFVGSILEGIFSLLIPEKNTQDKIINLLENAFCVLLVVALPVTLALGIFPVNNALFVWTAYLVGFLLAVYVVYDLKKIVAGPVALLYGAFLGYFLMSSGWWHQIPSKPSLCGGPTVIVGSAVACLILCLTTRE